MSWPLKVIRAARECLERASPFVSIIQGREWIEDPKGYGKWAVLPATFNPPTLAHGEMARWALQEGQCREVLLLIDLRHADKEAPEAHLLDRLMMAKLAFLPEEGFSLGISSHGRFLDKALALEALFGEKRSWCFIVGSDALRRILQPIFYTDPRKELETLFQMASFVVFRRADEMICDQGVFPKANLLWKDLPEHLRGLSSSMVRQAIREGKEWKIWVHPAVASYIEKNSLYKDPSLCAMRLMRLQNLFQKHILKKN